MKLSVAGSIVLRLGLGGVLLVAGCAKLFDPSAFANAIITFQIVSLPLVPWLAVTLPFFEFLLGIMLLTGWQRRGAAFSAALLLAMYTVALTWGMARDLPLQCDCFGISASAPEALLRDGMLLAGTVVLYGWEVRSDEQAFSSRNDRGQIAKAI